MIIRVNIGDAKMRLQSLCPSVCDDDGRVVAPLDALARASCLPALLIAIVFRTWAGHTLWKSEHQP